MKATQLTALPEGVLAGLSSLNRLWLHGNAVDPLPLGVTLESAGEAAFQAVASAGAPHELVLPIVTTNGNLEGDAATVTIAAGATRSPAIAVTRDTDAGGAVAVDIGTLPDLPADHRGYELVKSGTLPLRLGSSPAGICDRTEQVRDAIMAAINGVDDCADVTEAHLAGITGGLVLIEQNIVSLQSYDFEGCRRWKCFRLTKMN